MFAVVLVPLQSAAEEYVFRGQLMQTIGSWLKRPAFAILLPVPLFVVGHDYDLWGQLDIAVLALAAGWLAWRTGGLEAPIALHLVNNVLFTVMTAFGYADPNSTHGTPTDLAASAATTLFAIAWLVRTFDRTALSPTNVAVLNGTPSVPGHPQLTPQRGAGTQPWGYRPPAQLDGRPHPLRRQAGDTPTSSCRC